MANQLTTPLPIIKQVWDYNYRQELNKMNRALHHYPIICLDTEFPGFLRETPRYVDEVQTYSNLKFNVDATRLIQLGITLLDDEGNVFSTWEFNFQFDLRTEVCGNNSIEFLISHGIDFDKHRTKGIDGQNFSMIFTQILRQHRNLKWVFFHGLYDIAHTLKLVTRIYLPDTLSRFAHLASSVFGKIVDVKYMARFCEGLHGGELGLQKLAAILGLERVGGAHQAGSDSLLTARVFATMKNKYQAVEEEEYEGYLYGISLKICTPQVFTSTTPHPNPTFYCYQHQPRILTGNFCHPVNCFRFPPPTVYLMYSQVLNN